jgi:hypothetical protein
MIMVTREKKDYTTIFKYLDWEFLKEVGDVMKQGEIKHGFESFKNYNKSEQKGIDKALIRHLLAYEKGEKLDTESGFSHLSHIVCNLMFLYYFDNLEVTK